MERPVLEVRDLVKYYRAKSHRGRGVVRAVDGVSFTISRGETMGLVGESGSGKSTVARLVLRLLQATRGSILFEGQDVTKKSERDLQEFRRHVQIVFQDPYASLDPRMTVHQSVAEPMRVHGSYRRGGGGDPVSENLERVGIDPSLGRKFPYQLSGGQRQRVAIARAISLHPKLLVLDEPVSALDLSVQAQVLLLLRNLQKELGLAYLFISHDLAVVRYVCHTTAVMYLGQIVEHGDRDDIFTSPRHPYTKALLSAVPSSQPQRGTKRIILEGDPPSPANPPSGCRFHTRCWKAQDQCSRGTPTLQALPDTTTLCACFFPEPRAELVNS